jgi:hypothetical protein
MGESLELPTWMSEEDWRHCTNINAMFAAMEQPSDQQLYLFVVECCRRIQYLITDDASLRALDALVSAPDHAFVAADIAVGAQQMTSAYINPESPLFNPARNRQAALAVAEAVRSSLPLDNVHHSSDIQNNARLVALNCQWAVARAAGLVENDGGIDEDVDAGAKWLSDRAEQAEEAAQCDLVRTLFVPRPEFG